ncbi:Fumarate hydratase class II [Candidatus Bilamarchaeum dharawalense]|uniref:Fumarate hydratase class II n=1 Tax=Candidatus Bilamarchaeum dharawalense TaxID=2885759 RepID=A0A5E4LPR0_9ARCH|nr:Fumarate hydratase class II [Candidatus Bilamarchaeum dharawalense]
MRTEEDFLGKVGIPDDAYYGSFTARASKNFQLSGILVHKELIKAVALIKKSAALANVEIGQMDRKVGEAIVKASEEVIAGKFDKEFILDAFQAGAGTPLHMNVNEVIANRAEELLGGKKGSYALVHPNNHVNMSQSSNNVVPSAIKIAAMRLTKKTIQEAELLKKSFENKAAKYKKTLKIGRTHLQDAVPMTYGQVFGAYARAIEKDIEQMKTGLENIEEIGVGGTAIGSGITAHPKFRETVTKYIRKEIQVKIARDGIEITQNMNDFVTLSGSYRRYAITLTRIANDLRLLVSGPKAGIAEIILPEVEPGSSIMPGKINPSIPEAVNMLAFQVIGNDQAIMLAAQSGQLELNFATPLIAHNVFQSAELLANGSAMFRIFCIDGLEVDEETTKNNFEKSFGYATALNPYLGYKEVSLLVKEAYQKKTSLKELILAKGIMNRNDLEKIIATATGPCEVDREIKKRLH